MKKLLIALCLMLLPCMALANSCGTLFEPPQEVLDHIAERWSAYALEDYCEIEDTPKGDYGFALLKSSKERLLVGYHEEGGKMKYWLKNAGAVPQAFDQAKFFPYRKGDTLYDTRYEDASYSAENGGFSVGAYQATDGEPVYQAWIHYAWDRVGFHLVNYSVEDDISIFVEDEYIEVWNWQEKSTGTVYGAIQTDIHYVSYNALPKTIDEARRTITTAPEIIVGNFRPKEIKFTGGQKYPVYTGPGEEYARSGNGKGMVSTNDWIEVFGQYGDWIMIQYDISAEQYRIGWIDAASLPKNADVPRLGFEFIDQRITQNCTLTDDPLNSEKKLISLKAGTEIISLADFGEHFYIEVTVDGKTYWGFVDADCITKG